MSPVCDQMRHHDHLAKRELWRANRLGQHGTDKMPLVNNDPMDIEMTDLDTHLVLDSDAPGLDGVEDSDIVLPPPRRASVEDAPELPAERYAQPCPSGYEAGATFGTAKTPFDTIRDDQILQGAEVWGPFRDDKQWQLAKWLIKNVGHSQAEEFLKLGIIQDSGLDYPNKDRLYKAVDELPSGLDWQCKEIIQTGDLKNANGIALTETLEVWYRDPLDCIRELLGNPLFANTLAYAPEQVYRDREGTNRHIDETWSADWWWNLQREMPVGTTIAPVILSSDKTRLSQFRGDKSAWPIYLTIGNLAKEVRRSPTMHGTVLLGYLPVGKFDCFSEGARSLARYQAFHSCMRIILDSLVEAGKSGTYVTCADRYIRFVKPILAAYVADYPEQCLVGGSMENRCPIGQIAPDKRGSHEHCMPRDREEILGLLDAHRSNSLSTQQKEQFKSLGLRAIHEPFWRDLPHADIFTCFTPDLLHQLHKGVFKDHLVKWCTNLIGEKELDSRFRSVPTLSGLRHFKNGISSVSQWTGHEHKEMEKVFLGLVAGGVEDEVVLAVRALMDFLYLASLQAHTSVTLASLQQSLHDFHLHKQAFIDLGARHPEHFNIPKYHMLEHYVQLILNFGSADGFNTEWSERLHIDYAKDGYRASNKKDYIAQMTKWLSRQEAVDRFTVYLEWYKNGEYKPTSQALTQALPEPAISVDPGTITANSRMSTYQVAATHPATLRAVPASNIIHIKGLGATQFLPALHEFLIAHGSSIVPHTFDKFDLFKQLIIQLPVLPETGKNKCKNIIRASPPVIASRRQPAQPARCDFALVRTGRSNTDTEPDGSPLQGIRIAHVRAIFKLPATYGIRTLHPLVYVEWFTPFRTPDLLTGMHIVSRSTRMHHVYGEIIEAHRL
ncbi:hypothetical protein PHLCEN_2v4306, partial [Hermanssonia centrifuga]